MYTPVVLDAARQPVFVGDTVLYVRKPGSAESRRFISHVVGIHPEVDRHSVNLTWDFITIEFQFELDPFQNAQLPKKKLITVSSLNVVKVNPSLVMR